MASCYACPRLECHATTHEGQTRDVNVESLTCPALSGKLKQGTQQHLQTHLYHPLDNTYDAAYCCNNPKKHKHIAS